MQKPRSGATPALRFPGTASRSWVNSCMGKKINGQRGVPAFDHHRRIASYGAVFRNNAYRRAALKLD